MTKEKLQIMYNEASEEALKYRAVYRNLEALVARIEKSMDEIAEEGAHYEAIVYHSIEVGANDTRGWLDDEEEGVARDDEWDEEEDEEEEWDEDEDEEEDDEEVTYDPCEDCDHDCRRCAFNM